MTKTTRSNTFFIVEPQRIRATELNRLHQSERLEIIRNSRGKMKYEMLLDARDCEQLVPMLHPQEIYLTVSELGPEYTSELLLLASTAQITTLLDLDCWEGDQLDRKATLQWLSLLLETGEMKVHRTIAEMEPELFVLMLKSFITITAGPEAYDDDSADGNANRLEGLYDINYHYEESAKIIGGLLKIIQQKDQQIWMHLLEMTRSELDSVLEEEVYQARSNRLLDYGFSSPAEARSIYTRVDPGSFVPASGKEFDLEADGLQSPLPLLRLAQPGGLLAEILSSGIDHSLATELCLLANRKMAADLIDLSREEEVSLALAQLYDGLNLGLEHLVGNDVVRAEAIFKNTYLQQVYQLGHSLVANLADQAKTLLSTPAGKLFDGPYRRFIDSLQQNPPLLFCGIRVGDPQQPEAIRTRKQLDYIATILQQLELQQRIFDELLPDDLTQLENLDLAGCNIETGTDLTLSDLFLTSLANQLLGAAFTPQPLAASELTTLYRLVVQNGKLNPQIIEQVRRQLDQQLAGASGFADYCLEIWQEDFCQMEETEIDPRYLSGLIVRLNS